MVDVNTTIPFLEPLARSMQTFIDSLQLLLGGLFGLYLIVFIVRWYSDRKLWRALNGIRSDLAEIKKGIDALSTRKKR
jgi:hypothetical protein